MASRLKPACVPCFKTPKEKKPKQRKPLPRSRGRIKQGKKAKANSANVAYLKKKFLSLGITYCVLQYPGCWREVDGFAHSKRRRFINDLETMREAIPACNECHRQLDLKPHEETERIVKRILEEIL